MQLRFHEIGEANHRILNPLTTEKFNLIGEICGLDSSMSLLDLCCGKGEMLCQWAARYGIKGIGVDISPVFLDAARERAAEMKVSDKLTFIQQDAATYPRSDHSFDLVSCIGATHIGDGLVGTIKLMKPALKYRDSLILIGEPYWIDQPPSEAFAALEVKEDEYTSLDGMLDRFEEAKVELVEMVLGDGDSWDRYASAQWMTLTNWLHDNPDDKDAPEIRKWLAESRRAYLKYGRRYFGWGVFVLRPIA